MPNKYPQYVSIRKKYVWCCGDTYATISMHPDEMDNMDEFGKTKLMEEVNRIIGKHEHDFSQVEDNPDNQVILVCEKWNYKKAKQ